MQNQFIATLVRAKQLPCCSVLLCKTGSQQPCATAICTCGDLLFIQMCSDATPMHCSTAQGKTASLLFSAALQNRLTAALCHCNCTCGDLLFIQVCSDATPLIATLVRAKQLPCCSVLLCKTGSQQPCATAIAFMEVCSSYRCAVMQHKCTATLVRAK